MKIVLKKLCYAALLGSLAWKAYGDIRLYIQWQQPHYLSQLRQLQAQEVSPSQQFKLGSFYLLNDHLINAIMILKQLPDIHRTQAELIPYLQKQAHINTDQWIAPMTLALAYVYTDQAELAYQSAQATLSTFPNIGWNHVVMGFAASKLNRPQEALSEGEAAAQFLPRSSLVQALLTIGYFQNHHTASGLIHLGKLLLSISLIELVWLLSMFVTDFFAGGVPLLLVPIFVYGYLLILRRCTGIKTDLFKDLAQLR